MMSFFQDVKSPLPILRDAYNAAATQVSAATSAVTGAKPPAATGTTAYGAKPATPAANATSSAASSAGAGNASAREQNDEKKEKEKSMGTLDFELDYDFEKGNLTVKVVQAQELPAMDLGGTSDPYVKVYVLPDKKKKFTTKVYKKTLNPVFNESFVFPKLPYADISGKTLVFQVYDHDQFGGDDQIGEVQVPLGSVDLAGSDSYRRGIKLPPKDVLGDICFSLRYVPQKSQLTVVIMECKNLKKMDITGASDPYVKLALMEKGKRIKKSKTSIKMATLNPYFNESFKFEVTPQQIQRIELHLTVMDYDRVGSNDAIGMIIMGCGVGGNPQKHWMEMINGPRRSIAQWQTLQPIVEDKKK